MVSDPEADQRPARHEDDRLPVVEEQPGRERGPHTEGDEGRRQAGVEDHRAAEQGRWPVEGVGEEGRQQQGAARAHERQDAAEERGEVADLDHAPGLGGGFLDDGQEDLGRLGAEDRATVDEERRRAGHTELLRLLAVALDGLQGGGVVHVRTEPVGIEAEVRRHLDEAVLAELADVALAVLGEDLVVELPEGALCRRGATPERRGDGLLAEDRRVAELDPEDALVDVALHQLGVGVTGEDAAERALEVGVLDHHHGCVDRARRVGVPVDATFDEAEVDAVRRRRGCSGEERRQGRCQQRRRRCPPAVSSPPPAKRGERHAATGTTDHVT
jgi:hypothetical protein